MEQQDRPLEAFSYLDLPVPDSLVGLDFTMGATVDGSFWLPPVDFNHMPLSFTPPEVASRSGYLADSVYHDNQSYSATGNQLLAKKETDLAVARNLVYGRWHTRPSVEPSFESQSLRSQGEIPSRIDDEYRSRLSKCLEMSRFDTALPPADFLVSTTSGV